MSKQIFRNLEMYFPFVFREMEEMIETDSNSLAVKLQDGSWVLYDDYAKTIRNLPKDINNMTEEECRNEFGKRLYRIMYLKGITQQELSDITGISQPMISAYVSGKVTPSFYKVDKIAKAIGCSADDLRYVIHKKGNM